ncbi:phage baseplate protein [Providencia rettgeri]|uniref:phage baseplate protein n=1 Tax=Providencia rettgeri TaxID=587 RepID=UPI00290FBF1F|nr:phage baseplate protein [Providencia rettgeri]EMA4647342.1 phage baseplate protein [Providencia rettgeri]WRR98704.1 phage baseplate protein [Providencia rettgeri]
MSQNNSELPYYPEDICGGARTQEFIINSLIGRVGTVTICRIVKVKGGGVGPVGFVDIVPMVLQIDGAGNAFDNATVFNVPYFRYQGGSNAVILDPKVGDIGICLVASRDISKIKRTKKDSTPDTKRQYDIADSLYIGGILNGTPSQYIHFLDSGINVVSTGVINLKGTEIVLDAPVNTTSTIIAAGDITDNAGSGNSQTMASMRVTYNGHTHKANGEYTDTNEPNQQV